MPKFYKGRISLFLPFKRYPIFNSPELLWENQAEEVKVYELPVYPTGMLVEPFAQILAENLENAINKALEIELKSEI